MPCNAISICTYYAPNLKKAIYGKQSNYASNEFWNEQGIPIPSFLAAKPVCHDKLFFLDFECKQTLLNVGNPSTVNSVIPLYGYNLENLLILLVLFV